MNPTDIADRLASLSEEIAAALAEYAKHTGRDWTFTAVSTDPSGGNLKPIPRTQIKATEIREEVHLADIERRLREKGPNYGPRDSVMRHILNARDAIANFDGNEFDRESDRAEAILNRPWGNA